MVRKVLPLFLTLVMLSTACGILKTVGPEVSEEISIAVPDVDDIIHFYLSYGAGDLTISSGSDELVTGVATYNVEDLKPEVSIEENTVRLRQGTYNLDGIPFPVGMVNKWELQLGNEPMELEISAGAYSADFDFGGLSLTKLTIKDGASDVELDFSTPNLTEMSLLRYETGASNVNLSNLANANFSYLQFECGAGSYIIDFSGELKRDASINIEAGLGSMILIIPENVSAEIVIESGLSNVNVGSNWSKSGSIYTQNGSGPKLSFIIEIGAGSLTVR